ncbi:VENN motif pre-toxin domain-containing protein [Gilliamella sp. WF3-4]|uniref:VENN motif pre-toxin domain-containing protein n=1 Tax=Gilliamella sp. WF3-4 TaxID=3120255 RepID=UPI00080E0611|nr:VENN motif pre-toxin domain-containing protein [Gilliamella apicola]OCG15037.1 hypothetical protein A9G47_12625 [Gilliamella apicola]
MGGLGAAASERSAEVIAGILYPDKAITELSQEERQKISALSQLATGLAIAASGGDIQDMNTGIATGKNAVENNAISGQFVGKTDEEIRKMIYAQTNCENDREGCQMAGKIAIGLIF